MLSMCRSLLLGPVAYVLLFLTAALLLRDVVLPGAAFSLVPEAGNVAAKKAKKAGDVAAKVAKKAGDAAPKKVKKIGNVREALACPFNQDRYYCSSPRYKRWLQRAAPGLLEAREEVPSVLRRAAKGGDVLFVGNSHTRQEALALLCHLQSSVVKFWATDDVGCLARVARRKDCNGNDCRTDLAMALLKGGRKVFVAVNHPWVHEPKRGFGKVTKALGLDYRKVGLVFLGSSNNVYFAETFFSKFNKKYSRCGTRPKRGFSELNRTQWRRMMKKEGFRGRVVRVMQFPRREPGQERRRKVLEWADGEWVMQMGAYDFSCFVEDCSEADGGHSCMPGPVDGLMPKMLRELAEAG